MTKQEQAVKLITRFEGCKLQAYPDSGGIWTLGIGTIKLPDGREVEEGDTCTLQEAESWLNHHLEKFVYKSVDNLVSYSNNPSDELYASLCSFGYNCGTKYLFERQFIDPIRVNYLGDDLDLDPIHEAIEERNWPIYDKLIASDSLAHVMLRFCKVRDKETGLKKHSRGLARRRLQEIKYYLKG